MAQRVPAREAAAPRRGIVTDVAAHGVRNPILLYDDDGTRFILDGIHRYRAARRAGQPCPTRCLRVTGLPPLPRRTC